MEKVLAGRAQTERLIRAHGLEACILLSLPRSDTDRDQISERLRWTPRERLDCLLDVLPLQERARRGRTSGRRYEKHPFQTGSRSGEGARTRNRQLAALR